MEIGISRFLAIDSCFEVIRAVRQERHTAHSYEDI